MAPKVGFDQRPRFTVRDHAAAALLEKRHETRVGLALVPAAQQQHEGAVHRLHGDQGGRDVGRFRIVDPQDAADLAHTLEAVRQRRKRSQPFGEHAGRHARLVGGERCRERVRHVVVAEQLQVPAARQHVALEPHHTGRRVVPRVGGTAQRKPHRPARDAPRQVEHSLIVAVQDPELVVPRVVKQQSLVGVVRLDRGVAVEMVGRKVGDDADVGEKIGAVVQLKRRHFDHEPLIGIPLQRRLRQRAPDVPHGLRAQPGRAEQVRHQGGGRRLAVGAGDGDAAAGDEAAEPDVDLRHDRDPGTARRDERRRIRGDAGRRDDRCRRADARQVVAPHFDDHPGERPQLGEALFTARMVRRVARVHPDPRMHQQARRGDTAPPQSDHGDLAAAPGVGDHRTLRVARAIAAHSTPRI